MYLTARIHMHTQMRFESNYGSKDFASKASVQQRKPYMMFCSIEEIALALAIYYSETCST